MGRLERGTNGIGVAPVVVGSWCRPWFVIGGEENTIWLWALMMEEIVDQNTA